MIIDSRFILFLGFLLAVSNCLAGAGFVCDKYGHYCIQPGGDCRQLIPPTFLCGYSQPLGYEGLDFNGRTEEPCSMINEKIRFLGKDRFDEFLIDEFIAKFNDIAAGKPVVDSILQISTDEGEELEIGFFTSDTIADITLSRGKVYSCTYPLSKVRDIKISDANTKWILTIIGEKKFDYNVVKPESVESLQKYEASIRQHLQRSSE